MKKKIIILIIVFLSFNMGTIFFYGKYNSNEKTMLTKNEIFDIIDNIEDIVITSISTDGQNFLSEENKLDATILYIVSNKTKYQEYIISDYNQDLSSEAISLGKIDYNVFSNIANELFGDIDVEKTHNRRQWNRIIYLGNGIICSVCNCIWEQVFV